MKTFALYKGYFIEAIECSPGSWCLRVQRQDGGNIETIAGEFESIAAAGIEAFSASEALEAAQEMIDDLHQDEHLTPPRRH